LAAIAFEKPLEFEARLRALPRQRADWAGGSPVHEPQPAVNGNVEPWELHSELVLVCPKVREHALELLPERAPDAFLVRTRELPAGARDDAQDRTSLPVAVVGYALWRLAETARSGVVAIGAVVALALLAQVLH